MIEKERYCDEVLDQISSIHSALNGFGKLLLEDHLKNDILHRLLAGDREAVHELVSSVNKITK